MNEQLLLEVSPGCWESIGTIIAIRTSWQGLGDNGTTECELVPNSHDDTARISKLVHDGTICDFRISNSTIHAFATGFRLDSENAMHFSHYDRIASPRITLTLNMVAESVQNKTNSVKEAVTRIQVVTDMVKTKPMHRKQFVSLLVDAKKNKCNLNYAGVTFSIEQAEELLDGSLEEFTRSQEQYNQSVRRQR